MRLSDLQEYELVERIGEEIGYGRMMQLAQEAWRNSLARDGWPIGGEFAYGPCVAMLVRCGCKHPGKCDWCCGTGKLTKHVKKIKDQLEKK